MNQSHSPGPVGLPHHDGSQAGSHRLRAVVATYRPALQAYTLAVTPAELMALSGMPGEMAAVRDPRAHAHLSRLRDEVRESGVALPGAIVVAVSGGHIHCECDHLYALALRPQDGDRLIVMDGNERLLALAHGERRHCKTLVSAVLWRTAVESAAVMPRSASFNDGFGAEVVQASSAQWADAVRVWH